MSPSLGRGTDYPERAACTRRGSIGPPRQPSRVQDPLAAAPLLVTCLCEGYDPWFTNAM
jgi:hypothetical protein